MAALSFGVRLLFIAYALSIEVLVWLALAPALWIRSLTRGGDLSELWQRLGHLPPGSPDRNKPASSRVRPILIHAVSVGEMHAAAPLIEHLAREGQQLLLTTGTDAGLRAARRLAQQQPAVAETGYLPWDRTQIRHWLATIAPASVVVVETEIWPNLFRACGELRIPLVVANGRLRARDVRRYRILYSFFSRVLGYASWIGVQSASEEDRYLAIGAPADRVVIAGNLKADAALAAGAPVASLRSDADPRPVVMAGSTHQPEEQCLLECARLLAADGLPVRLVLAPRHIGRADRILSLARASGQRACRWSELTGESGPFVDTWDVVVVDRYGTLRSCYGSADLVVMGGTLTRIGGHNVFEPAALNRPILVGPHTAEINDIVQALETAGALRRVAGPDLVQALTRQCKALLQHGSEAQQMGHRAGEVCRQHAGSAQRHARAILARLETSG